MIQRACLRSTIIPKGGGKDGNAPLYIAKDDIIEIHFYSMMRDKSLWGDDAEIFKPERWEKIRPRWEYTPFGGGPRTCPALRLVFTECAFVMVTMVRDFERLELRDKEMEWKEEMRLKFESKNGCLVALYH